MKLKDRYPPVLATHQALLRVSFAANEGHEVDTQGDSFFVVFRRATQAVAAAVASQRAAAIAYWLLQQAIIADQTAADPGTAQARRR